MTHLHNAFFARIERADWLLPTLARLVFAATLLMYFWISGLTKLGEGWTGIFFLSDSAYIQMFPKAVEALGYDTAQLSIGHRMIALVGTWAEFILPLFIVLGVLTRLSALGMIGFIAVQSVVDVLGHGVAAKDIGTWFDRTSGALILDQRAFWILLLLILVIKGAGPLSFDRALAPMKPV
ncbi:DoxX family membrane protein [Pseudosulfitobacter sp. SM2401]|uniref:DoxX family protein n=1 Tax=Pseudosulfitobacter sp. SM2401 TaxID=3350098 RepID=UPI0036F31387